MAKNLEVKFPWMQVSQFCNGAEMTYIFPIALKETLRFFLKSASEKYLKISPRIHSTETRAFGILWLEICSRWEPITSKSSQEIWAHVITWITKNTKLWGIWESWCCYRCCRRFDSANELASCFLLSTGPNKLAIRQFGKVTLWNVISWTRLCPL